jgi:HlyD family secretion protein
MDKPLDGKIKRRKQIITYSVTGAMVLTAFLFFILRDSSSKLNVKLDKITIDEVKKDLFQDYISVVGTVEPIQSVYLDATEGGRVEEIFIREGAMVQKGDAIMRLSNDNLLLEISNYEAEVERAINDLKTMRVNLENQEINNKTQLVDLFYDLLKLERDYKNNKILVHDKYIPETEYLLSKENYERSKKRYDLLSKKSVQDSLSINIRISSSEASVQSMQKNMSIIRNRLDKLSINAPVNGELASLNPELGQVITYGTRIGTINILDSYKVKAEIDEHYISRVKLKLKAFCEFANIEYEAIIRKIYPQVKDGKFSVDMEFTKKVPQDMRIGQTSRIRLELGASETAIMIPRGGFYQVTGGQWIYLLDKSRHLAIKRNIKIGRQNPVCYEVLEGIQPGEKVIISGYENFGNADKLVLK